MALRRFASEMPAAELAAPALAFAPHPDDETLGCGGTIVRKRTVGADVRIVFVTDGGASHGEELISREELSEMRKREATEAARRLGVDASRLIMLGLPDGALSTHFDDGVARVRRLLEEHAPAQLFVPYHVGEHADHKACAAIVQQAARESGWSGTIYEYPVWLWRHWPTVPFGRTWGDIRAVLGATFRARFGLTLLTHFRTKVSLGASVAAKREALACHASQMTRHRGDERWGTLLDFADGEFIALLLRDCEYFRRVELGGCEKKLVRSGQ